MVSVIAAALPCRAYAERIERNASESDQELMVRAVGDSVELAHKVVRSKELVDGKLVLAGFSWVADEHTIVGHLLIEISADHFEHVTFPTECDEEGGAPSLDAVFFARTAKGPRRDLGLLCSWESSHAVVNGMSYRALFYRVIAAGSHVTVEPAAEMNKKFDTSELVTLNKRGKWVRGTKARFRTVADVKKLLRKMGLDP